MAGMRAISAGGRALLVAGAAVLLGSLFVLPWFEVSGTRPDLPAGRYGGVGGTGLGESLLSGPWGGVALLWLLGAALPPFWVRAPGPQKQRTRATGGGCDPPFRRVAPAPPP